MGARVRMEHVIRLAIWLAGETDSFLIVKINFLLQFCELIFRINKQDLINEVYPIGGY
jgi:hypothetical protein